MAVYATAVELAAFTGQTAPTDAVRLLERASEVIDDHTRTAVYEVDEETGSPADPVVLAAFRDATCAQVEFWLASDEEDDILGPVQSLSLGSMSVEMGATQYRTAPLELAPRAARILRNAHLYSNDAVRW